MSKNLFLNLSIVPLHVNAKLAKCNTWKMQIQNIQMVQHAKCRTCKKYLHPKCPTMQNMQNKEPAKPASSWRPFGPLDFILRARKALRPHDLHRIVSFLTIIKKISSSQMWWILPWMKILCCVDLHCSPNLGKCSKTPVTKNLRSGKQLAKKGKKLAEKGYPPSLKERIKNFSA